MATKKAAKTNDDVAGADTAADPAVSTHNGSLMKPKTVETLNKPIDERMKALEADHKRMGAR